jgi:dolichyl-phosphate beta-glucosyltransferase
MHKPVISIVIPAFNEEDRIGSTLSRVVDYFKTGEHSFEVVVVDDGSSDGTVRIVQKCRDSGDLDASIRLICNEENRGKGYSVRRGMLEADGRYGLLSDADLSTPIEEYAKLEREVIGGDFDIAIGSRDVEGANVEVRQSAIRENSGKLYNVFVRTLTGLPFRDTQCGFKLFDLRQKDQLFGRQLIERFSFDVELLIIARRLGMTIREVPVVWRHDSGSKVNFVRDGSRMLLDLLRVRWNALRGKYR